jgi:predicted RNase H-like nuclease (RuvC/YqgF family)
MIDDPNLRTDVEILKRDMHQLNGLFARLDVTIEKLSEVSSNLTRMIAVHENRLEKQEEADKHLNSMIELLFAKVEERRREVDTIKDDFRKEISHLHNDIMGEMKEIKACTTNYHNELNNRVTAIERWKWMMMGGGAIIGFIASKFI